MSIGKHHHTIFNLVLQRLLREYCDDHVHGANLDRAAQRLHINPQHEHADDTDHAGDGRNVLHVHHPAQELLRDELYGPGFLPQSGSNRSDHVDSCLVNLLDRLLDGSNRKPKD